MLSTCGWPLPLTGGSGSSHGLLSVRSLGPSPNPLFAAGRSQAEALARATPSNVRSPKGTRRHRPGCSTSRSFMDSRGSWRCGLLLYARLVFQVAWAWRQRGLAEGHEAPERDEQLASEGGDTDRTWRREGTTEALPDQRVQSPERDRTDWPQRYARARPFCQSSSATDHSVR